MANAATGTAIVQVGIAIITGLVATALVSGLDHLTRAHLTPAVSLAFAMGRHFLMRNPVPYWPAQLGGAPGGDTR